MNPDSILKRLNRLPDVFAKKYQLKPEKTPRQRCFTSKLFFFTMLQLVAGTNEDGYQLCLAKVFSTALQVFPPVKSAFSKFTLNEIKDAAHLIKCFSSLTLFLYDRLYFCERIVSAHFQHGSYFLIRCRKSAHKKNQEIFRECKVLCQYALSRSSHLSH